VAALRRLLAAAPVVAVSAAAAEQYDEYKYDPHTAVAFAEKPVESTTHCSLPP